MTKRDQDIELPYPEEKFDAMAGVDVTVMTKKGREFSFTLRETAIVRILKDLLAYHLNDTLVPVVEANEHLLFIRSADISYVEICTPYRQFCNLTHYWRGQLDESGATTYGIM